MPSGVPKSGESLQELRPDIAEQWHPTRNDKVTPRDVKPQSNKKYWWRCGVVKTHEWFASPNSRQSRGCPYCSGKRVSPELSLAALHPDIAKQWHPTRNLDITATDVTAGSKKNVWWKCVVADDHEWQMTVQNRTKQNQGCPYCAGRRPSSTNNLQSWCQSNGQFGEILLKQFDSEKNQLSLSELTVGSHQLVWWKCFDCTESFSTPVNRRTSAKTGCPYCSGHKVNQANSFATLHPELLNEWDFDRNLGLTPDSVTSGSNRKVWWRCQMGSDHIWQAAISSRTGPSGTNCPFCRGIRASMTNSLASQYPEIAIEWHASKNGSLLPHNVTFGSGRSVWWQCSKFTTHEWEMPVVARTGQKQGCPFCASRRVDKFNSLDFRFPEFAHLFDSGKNGILAQDVLASSTKKYWWKCSAGPDHEWLASPLSTTSKNEACPFCPPRMTQLSVTNSLLNWALTNDERGQRILSEWDSKANGDLLPEQVIYTRQRQKIHWACEIAADHRWSATAYERTVAGKDCPFCEKRRPSSTNNLAIIAPELAAFLHPTLNGALDPTLVSPTSHQIFWWKCPIADDHIWKASVNQMNGKLRCGFCAGKKVSSSNSLATKFPAIAEEFDCEKNSPLTPNDITFGSGKKYWWKCAINSSHSWRATASSRTGQLKTGCPECVIAPRSRREIYLAHEIGTFFKVDQLDHRIRQNGKTFDCDIILRNERLIVEYDGSFWHKEKTEVDIRKTESLIEAGWRVVRVREAPLSPIQKHDVLCSESEPVVCIAARVLRTISEEFGISIVDLEQYESNLIPRGLDEAELFIQQLLNAPDAVTAYRQRQSWDRRFHELEEFALKAGTADPASIPDSPRKLITWVNKQKLHYASRSLSDYLILRLESLPGWHWSRIDFRWRKQYEQLQSIVREGVGFSSSSIGENLASWVVYQRKLFGLNQLDEEQIALLTQLPNWSWTPEQESWQTTYEALLEYVARTGSSLVPQNHRQGTIGLGVWVNKQRIRFRKGVLETDRQELLERLPDWTWNPTNSKKTSMFEALESFIAREGHANVPATHVENDVRLGQWVNGLRNRKRRGVLDPELEARLSSISTFSWEPLNEQVPKNIEVLERYLKHHPNVTSVRNVVHEGRKLNSIVTYVRRRYSDGSLPEEFILRLEALPNWSWSPFDDSFSLGFSHLQKYVKREGDARVPQAYVEDGFRLGGWVYGRRIAYRSGRLTSEQIELLEQLPGWTWNPPKGPRK